MARPLTVRAAEPLLRSGQRRQADFRIFCFPWAGASGAEYIAWEPSLDPSLEVVVVPLGGWWRRDETDLRRTVDNVCIALEPLLDRPFACFGHSLGSIAAFETARELRRRGRPPRVLFVSGRQAPHDPAPSWWSTAGDDAEILARMRQLGGTPPQILEDPDAVSFLVQWLRRDLALHASYDYRDEPPLSCRLVALAGINDEVATPAAMERWRHHTAGTFEINTLPGGHFFLLSDRDAVLAIVARHFPRSET